MLFVQIQNIFLPVCSSSSSILSRPFAATVTNWVTSRLHEPSKPARSFSLLRRHQLDPQVEGQEARERGGSLVKGMVGQSNVSHTCCDSQVLWKAPPGYFFLLCCRRACSLCRVPEGFDPAPMEKEGVAGDPPYGTNGQNVLGKDQMFQPFTFKQTKNIFLELENVRS